MMNCSLARAADAAKDPDFLGFTRGGTPGKPDVTANNGRSVTVPFVRQDLAAGTSMTISERGNAAQGWI